MGVAAQAPAPCRWHARRIASRAETWIAPRRNAARQAMSPRGTAVMVLACLLAASCGSDPARSQRSLSDTLDSDRNAGRAIIGNAINSDTRGPAAPSVNSGDGTPAAGTGIVPADSGLGLTPGFPITR